MLVVCAVVALSAVSPAMAANSGGVEDTPSPGDYMGADSTGTPVATGGTVTIDSDVAGTVRGGWAFGSAATTNTVTMTDGTVGGDVIGGNSGTAAATGNTVTISGGTVSRIVIGGLSSSGAVTGNQVTISGDTVSNNVIGGATSTGDATGNTVTISGGTVNQDVTGGKSLSGGATGNTVIINGGTVSGDVLGGMSDSGSATGNTVTMNGGTVSGTLFGGMSYDETKDAFTGNTLHMHSASASIGYVQNFATINFTYAGNANMGRIITESGQDVTINTNANAVTFGGAVDGTGAITKTGTGTLTLTGANTAHYGDTTVNAGSIVTSGNGTLGTGALTVNATASLALGGADQRVASLGGVGAIANNVALTVGDSTNASSTYSGAMSGTGSLTKEGTGTLTLSGANTFTGMTTVSAGTLVLGAGSLASSSGLTLYGGAAFDNTSGAHALGTGKQLWVNGANDQSATYTGNLNATGATLNFIAPLNSTSPLLAVTGTADISGSTVNVGIANNARLPAKTTITLINSTGALTATGLSAGSGIVGLTQVYVYDLTADSTASTLSVNIESKDSEPGVQKSPAEGKPAAVALVNQGADLAAGQGMFNARAAGTARGSVADNMGMAGFAAMSGGTSRYNTGSHVDVNSLSLMTGLAKTWQAPGGAPVDVLGGVFFEGGWGSYTSYTSLESGGNFKGKGDSRYMGGGLLGRVDVTESALKGLYGEASFRVGGLHTDYKSGVIPGSTRGERASYDTSATYYGAHLGLGYVWELSERANLDLYGKYLWTHTTASNVTMLEQSVRFKAVDSHRTRLGGRFSYAVNESITPYVGVAWDYEFDGKARSVIMGENAPAPSLKGSTGVGELGLTWKPTTASAFSIDAGVQGYTGKREGVSGNVQLKLEF